MTKLQRRKLLAGVGGCALAAPFGGLASILASARAPALAQGITLHWLRVNDFVPASDAFLRKELLPEAEKALGLKVNLETINGNDVQARITAGIQTSAGPDMINVFNNWAQLYAESVADVSDVADEIGNTQGGFYDLSTTQARNEKGWLAVPWCVLGILISYRRSWFEEVGFASFPQTWEQYREAGKKLKAMGRPIGQTLGHTYGDAPAFSYPYLWSWGARKRNRMGGRSRSTPRRRSSR
jgi:multiple sugar transport system substrate-binding protein